MEINQSTLKEFREDFQEAVKSLEEKYGIIIQAKGITYEPSQFHFKVEVKNGSTKEDVYQSDFNRYCSMYGLNQDDYMRTFTNQGQEYQIVGINPNKRKNSIIIKQVSNGKEYICSPDFIPFIREKREANVRHMHTCRYCGKLTEGDDKDLLCPDCQEMFGHTFYSEL